MLLMNLGLVRPQLLYGSHIFNYFIVFQTAINCDYTAPYFLPQKQTQKQTASKACPHVMISVDDNPRNLFMSSIANRQEKVFSLFYGLEAGRAVFVSVLDSSRNTMLHLAAKLSPPSQLARISGAALQLQGELQWYKVSFLHSTSFKKNDGALIKDILELIKT